MDVTLCPALDHPRSRGDHIRSVFSSSVSSGSPPLTRGPLKIDGIKGDAYGITPAHAGTTPSSSHTERSCSDHPRSRGDHSTVMRKSRVVLGSPPLTRGPPRSNISSNGNSRITPAHAGTTRKVNVSQSWKRDHPRSRGDHDHRDNLNIIHKGSPPLTRGPRGEQRNTV